MNPELLQTLDADNRRARRHRTIVDAEAFWARIQRPVGCWLYDGAKEANGYGYLSNPFGDQPKYLTAHRAAWIFANGPIPEGMRVLHKCDVRSCVNPDHLFLGTDAENALDRHRKGRDTQRLLKPAEVTEIKAALRTPYHGLQTKLASKFGVSSKVINKIRFGKTYKEIA
jgi:hypothetical protein